MLLSSLSESEAATEKETTVSPNNALQAEQWNGVKDSIEATSEGTADSEESNKWVESKLVLLHRYQFFIQYDHNNDDDNNNN